MSNRIRIRFRLLTFALVLAAVAPLLCAAQEKATAPPLAVKVDFAVGVPMRDGVVLSANVFRPDAPGRFPVVVVRTPYGKSSPSHFSLGRHFAAHGYVYVIEDSRGRHDSEGTFGGMHDEMNDGYDTIEWAAAQPWSNGLVGTAGGSYGGENQWMAAVGRPPHLKAMAVLFSPPGPFYNIPFQYGALTLLTLDWDIMVTGHDNQRTDVFGLAEAIRRLPLATIDEFATGRAIPLWKQNFEHPTYDDFWKAVDYERHYEKVDVPVLHMSGWHDDDQPGTFRNFTAMRRLGRAGQKLLVGPWPHGNPTVTKLGPLDFGPSAKLGLEETLLRWFDRWLKGVPNGVDAEPPVRIFVMGANAWRDEADWPLPSTRWTKYYFHSGGRANSLAGDGSLSPVLPKKEPPDRYVYDPADPTPFIVPASSAQIGGPDDYRPVGERQDVLVYTTPPLQEAIELTGPLSAKLFASSSAPDTDWNVMLMDVFPDGYALRLNDGVVRASFRESFENPTPIEPGKIYEYTIDCWATSIVVPKGHRLRVHVASAAFPKFDRNLNTGHRLGLDAEMQVARQTVYHDAKHPSHIVLPVIPGPEKVIPSSESVSPPPPGAAAKAEKPINFKGFSEFVTKTMAEWKVPGLAVSVVKDGKVIYAEGFGLRDVKQGLKVTPHTLFPIGSSSKAFTAAGIAILVDEGKVAWDKPVRTYLPAFKLADEYASEHATLRDLLSHRTGVARHDLMWMGGQFSREELFERLRYLEATQEIRAAWQYQNLMYMTAGYLAGQVSGTTWEDFTRQRILEPLGMKETNFSVVETQRTADFSQPYMEIKDKVEQVPFRDIAAIGPAGSINSNVLDMANWVLLNLNKGKFGGKQIISEASLSQVHSPQIVMPSSIQHDEILYSSYAMGWMVEPYRGHLLLHHGGSVDGFFAMVAFLPRDNFGAVILSNLNGNPVPTIIMYNLIDRILGLEEIDWSKRTRDQQAKRREEAEKRQKEADKDRILNTTPSHPLEDYAGEYEHPAYGTISVAKGEAGLSLKTPVVEGPLVHYHYDVFELDAQLLGRDFKQKVSFATDLKGRIASLSVRLEPLAKELVFTRAAEKKMAEKGFLEKFVGVYEFSGVEVRVALRGEKTLSLTIPGQPEYELVPSRGTEFNLKGLPDYSVEFKTDAGGVVTEVVFRQPNGTFTAKKK